MLAPATTNGHANGSAAKFAEFYGDDEVRLALHDAAHDLRRRGIRFTVCNGKVPIGTAWHEKDMSLDVLPFNLRSAKPPAIGVVLGPTGGIVDIEADGSDEEALVGKLFDNVIPETPTYKSKRGKHRLFAWNARLAGTGAAVINFTDDGKAKLGCRIGADGMAAQSIVPPSPDREWEPYLSFDDVPLAPLPDAVIEKLLAAATPPPSRATPTATIRARRDLVTAMRRATKGMADVADGTKRLYTCCCRCVELDASDDEAIAAVRAYESKAPFPQAFTDAEIVDRIRDAEKKVTRGSAIVIANYEEIEIEKLGEDGQAKTERKTVPKPMGEIIEEIHSLTGGWPRRADNMLFVEDGKGIDYFDRRTTAGLFGWLRGRCNVKWTKGGDYVAQAELFAEIERTARRYKAIELLPHEPPIEGIYYRGETPAPGDGTHLGWLLDRFRPETPIDRDLIQASFMTAFWGGAPGRRPAFVITSDDGRGVGKTTVAEMGGRLCGGVLDVSAGEDVETLKTRMLSPQARTLRVALLDNVKSLRLSWAELESLITATVISGRQLFVGEGQRPNLLTWFITLNGVSMATDMAQRSVIIKVVRGKNDGPWHEQTTAYIEEHRQQIIGDIIAALRQPRHELQSYSRWATWERDILCRLAEPEEAQKVIIERQGVANCEQDEAEIIEQYFAEQLKPLGYCARSAQVRIPVATAAYWFSKAVGEPTKTAAASKRLHQMAGEGQLKRIAPDSSRTYGRCFVWTGKDADIVNSSVASDLAERIARHVERQRKDS